jgi:hypothetical protein
MAEIKKKYQWKKDKLFIFLFIYWLVTLGGVDLFERLQIDKTIQNGWIGVIMWLVVAVCMFCERGDWVLWKKTTFFFLSILLKGLFSIPAVFTIGILCAWAGRQHLVNRCVDFTASLGVILIAMRRSWLFVETAEINSSEKFKIRWW